MEREKEREGEIDDDDDALRSEKERETEWPESEWASVFQDPLFPRLPQRFNDCIRADRNDRCSSSSSGTRELQKQALRVKPQISA